MDILLIWVNREAIYFWKQVWTGRIALIPFNKLSLARKSATTFHLGLRTAYDRP
jgi:hypothetical protein